MMKRFIKFIPVFFIAVFGMGTTNAQAPGDTVDVIHYDLHLDVLNLTAKTLYGRADVEYTVKHSQVQVITLELKQLQVDSVKSDSGTPLVFSRAGDRLSITLQSPISSSDTSVVSIWYHGVPYSEGWGGFQFSSTYAFNLGVGFETIPHNLGKAWFPCIDNFTDRALYDYYIRVASEHKAICGGLMESVTDNGDGTQTFHWKAYQTIPTYLASIAVGSYELVSDVFDGMEANIPITYYVRPSEAGKVAGTFLNMKNVAAAFESRFGPYPFSRIGITGTALGAMEHSENIFYPHSSINGNTSGEWLYAHELSHMWFGDMVTCASAADMWLNEGWARWCEIIFTEELYGKQQAEAYFKSLHYNVMRNAHLTSDGYLPLVPMPEEFTYGSTVYDKGALVAHTLRYYMGDSLFFKGVKHYLNMYAFDAADSYQLRDALEESSGIDLDGFFDFFVFSPGYTHYSVDSFKVSPLGDDFEVKVFMKQKLKGGTFYGEDCRVELSFMDSNWNIDTRQVEFSGSSDSVTVILNDEPALVMTDLNYHLADATTDESKILKTTGAQDYINTFCRIDVKEVIDSAYIRVTHNWIAPDSLINPQPGLRLSTNHYWTVEGIIPQGFKANGIFSYYKNILDGDIIFDAKDSLVMLYRPTPGENWQSVNFINTGVWLVGTLTIEDLKPGQYTFAVWDKEYVGLQDIPVNNPSLIVYPNPATDTFTIKSKSDKPAKLEIYSASGKKVFSHNIGANGQIIWSAKKGTYLINLLQQGNIITSTKAIMH